MRGMAVLLLGLGSLSAADDDPAEVLIRLRDQVLAHAERIPNHTCVETVRRDRYEAVTGPPARSCDTLLAHRKLPGFSSGLRLATTDRLRLDVLLAPDRELYSWAGARKFEEGEIDELVTQGAFGTGPFASMLLSVLQGRDARFVFEGDTSLGGDTPNDGRRVLEYSFSVAVDRSHYGVKTHGDWVATGYTGTILADPLTAELVRFSVRTEELPAETGSCEHDSVLEYNLVRLGSDDYLLPRMTRQRFIMRDGSEGENTITFSACRDFRGESAVNFSPKAADGKRWSVGAALLELPAGLPVTVELTSAPVRGDQAAAGDRIEGRLVNAIRDPVQQTVLAPAGAVMAGRLMRVETRWGPPVEISIALRWETVEVDGTATPIGLIPNRRLSPVRAIRGALQRRGVEIELALPGEARYGVYHVNGEHGVLDSGFRGEWLTATPVTAKPVTGKP
jgi:hypothetical protein